MKEIIFEKLILENFAIFKDRTELDLNGKMFFIFGPNGSGKSSLLNSFGFALYAMTPKNEKVNDLINTSSGKNFYIQLNVRINGILYIIKRFHKHKDFGSGATVELEDGTILKSGDREVTPFLKELVCMPDIFYNSIYFIQDFKNLFSNFSEIFYRILNLESYKEKYKKVREDIKDLEDDINNIDNEILIFQERNKGYQNSISQDKYNYLEKIKNIKNEILDILKEIDILKKNKDSIIIDEEKFNVVKKLNDNLNYEKNDILEKIKTLREKLQKEANNKYNELKIENNNIENKIKEEKDLELEKLINNYHTKMEKINVDSNNESIRLNDILTQIRDLNNEIKFIKNNLKSYNPDDLESLERCPTCLDIINEDKINNIKNKISELKNEILEKENIILNLNKEKKPIEEKINQLDIEFKKLEKEEYSEKKELISNYDNKLKTNRSKLSNAKEEIGNLMRDKEKTQRDKYKDRLGFIETELKRNREILEYIEKEKEDINRLVSEIKTRESLINEKNKNISYFKKTFKDRFIINKENIIKTNKEILNKNKEKEHISENLEILLFWKVAFSKNGIPNLIISNSVSKFNKWMSFFTDNITDGRYKVGIDPTKEKEGIIQEKPTLHILDNKTKKEGYKSVSGGYRRMIDVALFYSFNVLNSIICKHKFNLIMMDEILDGLDIDHKGSLITIVRSLKREKVFENMNMFLVSHTNIDEIDEDDIVIDLT